MEGLERFLVDVVEDLFGLATSVFEGCAVFYVFFFPGRCGLGRP